jgi:hypothetical protein
MARLVLARWEEVTMLADILEYRWLMRCGRQRALSTCEESRRQRLATRLAAKPPNGTRRFVRFAVKWRAGIVIGNRLWPVSVIDIGVGGMAIAASKALPDEEVQLIVCAEHRCYRVYARRCWQRGKIAGLSFPV